MFKKTPQIFSFSKQNLQDKINAIISVGLFREQVIKITSISSSVLTYDINSVQKKIHIFKKYGYTDEQIVNILTNHSSILGSSEENINNKLDFYLSIGLFKVVYLDPKQLIQSVDLTYARYKFYDELDLAVSFDNYKLLFLSRQHFNQKYNITSEKLIEMYPIEDENMYNGVSYKPKMNVKKIL